MHILYIHQHFSTPNGATGTRSYELSQVLLERGHQVTLICGANSRSGVNLNGSALNGRGYKRGTVDGIDLIELEIPYSNKQSFFDRTVTFMRFAMKSTKLSFAESYDLLFATTTPLTVGIPGIVSKPFKRKPFVFEVRDLWPELPREMGVITNPAVLKMMDALEWASYRSADRLIGLAPGMVEGIARRGIKEEKIAMIPNGCDTDLFKPRDVPRTLIPGIQEDDRVAVFTGAHGIANGLDAVLDAAVVLKKMGKNNIKLVFIGGGNRKQHLIERKEKEGLDNCLFLDPIVKKKLVCLLNAADVGMMILDNVPAFYYGTSPNKFFDYIASGLPVLNNYPGWLADLIEEYDCGEVVPPEDPEAFARTLIKMTEDPQHLQKQGKNARKLAEDQFDRQKLGTKFAEFLEETNHA